MPGEHAFLSPSAAERWLKCTPAPRLEAKFEEAESDYAREGTLAHSICECLLQGFLKDGITLLTLAEEKFFQKQEFYTGAMLEYCHDFAAYVLSRYAEGDLLCIEEKIDLTAYIPEAFGTTDVYHLQVKDKTLHIEDFKYGKGVAVSAADNPQLKIYALGVLKRIPKKYKVETVTLHIFQPRIANNSEYSISVKELLKWSEDELKPSAILAFNGEGVYNPGDHCLFCKAKANCRAIAEYNLALVKEDFAEPALLSDEELLNIFRRKSIFESWLGAVCSFVLSEAVKGNKEWPGYKLVEGKSNRVYTDEAAIEKVILEKLFISDMHKPKQLLGITELEAKLGKENFNTYVGPFLRKPPGAPTLTVETDARKVYSSAAIEFNDGWEPVAEVVADEWDFL